MIDKIQNLQTLKSNIIEGRNLMRAFDAYKILDEQEAGSLIDLIAPCMDDYLYIIDLKNDTLRISQSAVERFYAS